MPSPFPGMDPYIESSAYWPDQAWADEFLKTKRPK